MNDINWDSYGKAPNLRLQLKNLIKIYGVDKFLDNVYMAIEDIAKDEEKTIDERLEEIGKEYFKRERKLKKETGFDPSLIAINGKIMISQILKEHGIKVKGDKAICPFHEDKDPSLSFNDKKGLWKCWGCNKKGNTFQLIARMEILKSGQ